MVSKLQLAQLLKVLRFMLNLKVKLNAKLKVNLNHFKEGRRNNGLISLNAKPKGELLRFAINTPKSMIC